MVRWHVEVLGTPAWRALCARCGREAAHESTGLFRLNSNGERHDLWLLYRCVSCGGTAKRGLARRRLARELPAGTLGPYLGNDAVWARWHAFELPVDEPLPYRVLRPPLPLVGAIEARIAQPEPSGARWDRFLASELGLSRSHLARAAAMGELQLEGAASLARPVRDGQGFRLSR